MISDAEAPFLSERAAYGDGIKQDQAVADQTHHLGKVQRVRAQPSQYEPASSAHHQQVEEGAPEGGSQRLQRNGLPRVRGEEGANGVGNKYADDQHDRQPNGTLRLRQSLQRRLGSSPTVEILSPRKIFHKGRAESGRAGDPLYDLSPGMSTNFALSALAPVAYLVRGDIKILGILVQTKARRAATCREATRRASSWICGRVSD